jgi:hypothetical protein
MPFLREPDGGRWALKATWYAGDSVPNRVTSYGVGSVRLLC